MHSPFFPRTPRGFTLIELLIVIAILAILASVVSASIGSARTKARDARRLSEFREIQSAMELYHGQFGMYPCGDGYWGGVYSDYTVDSTLSDSFLDGEQPNPPGNGPVPDCGAAGVVDVKGLVTYGYYRQVKDPLNSEKSGQNYYYLYMVTDGRQSYKLFNKLEADDAKMQNDGGVCAKLYEVGENMQDITTEPSAFWGCN